MAGGASQAKHTPHAPTDALRVARAESLAKELNLRSGRETLGVLVEVFRSVGKCWSKRDVEVAANDLAAAGRVVIKAYSAGLIVIRLVEDRAATGGA